MVRAEARKTAGTAASHRLLSAVGRKHSQHEPFAFQVLRRFVNVQLGRNIFLVKQRVNAACDNVYPPESLRRIISDHEFSTVGLNALKNLLGRPGQRRPLVHWTGAGSIFFSLALFFLKDQSRQHFVLCRVVSHRL